MSSCNDYTSTGSSFLSSISEEVIEPTITKYQSAYFDAVIFSDVHNFFEIAHQYKIDNNISDDRYIKEFPALLSGEALIWYKKHIGYLQSITYDQLKLLMITHFSNVQMPYDEFMNAYLISHYPLEDIDPKSLLTTLSELSLSEPIYAHLPLDLLTLEYNGVEKPIGDIMRINGCRVVNRMGYLLESVRVPPSKIKINLLSAAKLINRKLYGYPLVIYDLYKKMNTPWGMAQDISSYIYETDDEEACCSNRYCCPIN